jgi:hypothetical protein
MPRGDKTGPSGLGPMTGRAAGYCAGYSVPGFMNPTRRFGRGFGRGLGRGFGRGWRVYPPVPTQPLYAYPTAYTPVAQSLSPEQEVAALENYQKELEAEKADLEQAMNQIKSRIKEIRTKLEK